MNSGDVRVRSSKGGMPQTPILDHRRRSSLLESPEQQLGIDGVLKMVEGKTSRATSRQSTTSTSSSMSTSLSPSDNEKESGNFDIDTDDDDDDVDNENENDAELSVFNMEDIVNHLQDALKKEHQLLLDDIQYLQQCIEEEMMFSQQVDQMESAADNPINGMDQSPSLRTPSMREMRTFNSKLQDIWFNDVADQQEIDRTMGLISTGQQHNAVNLALNSFHNDDDDDRDDPVPNPNAQVMTIHHDESQQETGHDAITEINGDADELAFFFSDVQVNNASFLEKDRRKSQSQPQSQPQSSSTAAPKIRRSGSGKSMQQMMDQTTDENTRRRTKNTKKTPKAPKAPKAPKPPRVGSRKNLFQSNES
eukprot:TRINITY_DN359_c0_g1_i1.p1 TRINITY_DN359_c0_g1~~TRINITY_DN359_c0_g1_i1.p1  ORF type:complete len:364 (-),score=133.95 TRINITY_DN359_c0_g1_i1:825-1916(-)